MWVGIEFQTVGAWNLKERWPKDLLFVLGFIDSEKRRQRKSVAQIAEGESGNLILYSVFHRSQFKEKKSDVVTSGFFKV